MKSRQIKTVSASARLDEVARILAAGVLRLRARYAERQFNDLNGLRAVPLDLSAERSVCGHEPTGDSECR